MRLMESVVRPQNLEILAIVRRELQGAGLLPTFRIALDPVLGGTPAEQPAKAAVKALGAELASSPGPWAMSRTQPPADHHSSASQTAQ